jgi:circadian clock protein KaiC
MKDQRVPSGIKGLDEMLQGGFLQGSVAVLTSIGIEFIARGIQQYGEPGLIITFEEFPRQLYRDALSTGFDLRKLEEEGKLRTIFTTPPVLLKEIQQSGGLLDRAVEEMGVRRIFVDSMTHLERISHEPMKLREIIYTFLNGLLRAVVSQEDPFITGTMTVAEAGLSYIADTIIQLRYVEINSSMQKAMLVLKHRASDHDKKIRQFTISSNGVEIQTPFEGREGILSGSPRAMMRVRRAKEFFE